MSAFYKDVDHQATEEESIRLIHQAIHSGVTMLDTSDMYGPYTNEELVGEALLQSCLLGMSAHEAHACASILSAGVVVGKLVLLVVAFGGTSMTCVAEPDSNEVLDRHSTHLHCQLWRGPSKAIATVDTLDLGSFRG